jgi:hypothetical protein
MHIQELHETACVYLKTRPECIVGEDTWHSSNSSVLMTHKSNGPGIIIAVHNPVAVKAVAYLGHFSLDTIQGERSEPYETMLDEIADQKGAVNQMSAWISGASTVKEVPGVDQDTLELYSQVVEADRLAVADALSKIGVCNILVNLLSGNRPVESAMLDPISSLLTYTLAKPQV